MADQPHPADYMSDAQYEQYVRDGGISGVSIDADILNYGIDADEELLIENYSGVPEDLSDRVIEVAMRQHGLGEPSTDDVYEWADGHEYCPDDPMDVVDEYEGQVSMGENWVLALESALAGAGVDLGSVDPTAPADVDGVHEYFDDRLDAGHWVTVADGKIVEEGEFHPFRVHVQTY